MAKRKRSTKKSSKKASKARSDRKPLKVLEMFERKMTKNLPKLRATIKARGGKVSKGE